MYIIPTHYFEILSNYFENVSNYNDLQDLFFITLVKWPSIENKAEWTKPNWMSKCINYSTTWCLWSLSCRKVSLGPSLWSLSDVDQAFIISVLCSLSSTWFPPDMTLRIWPEQFMDPSDQKILFLTVWESFYFFANSSWAFMCLSLRRGFCLATSSIWELWRPLCSWEPSMQQKLFCSLPQICASEPVFCSDMHCKLCDLRQVCAFPCYAQSVEFAACRL